MKSFEVPEMEIRCFAVEDVIATSGLGDNQTPGRPRDIE